MKIAVDTRDTKPKLYSLLMLTAAALIVAAVWVVLGAEKHVLALCLTTVCYTAATFFILIWAFREQIRYNPYSYNTIIYMGFALFDLFVLIIHVILAIRLITHAMDFALEAFLSSLLGSARIFMLVTFPLLLIFAGGLCISNIALIRHEGRRPVNLLGILLSILLIGGAIGLYAFDYSVSGSERELMIHDLVTNLVAAIYLYFECMMIGTIVADVIAARYEPEKNKDFMIILGCRVKKDGTPTPLLAGRIDRALQFARAQEEETGKALIFITSGGKGPDEPVSESAAMKQYLLDHGIPATRIVEEDQSTNTFQNMQFSKEKIQAIHLDGKVAFSTTNYHVFRSGIFARRVKMRAVGIGAPTKWYFWPNASVREFVGLLTKHRGKQALILIGMIVFYTVLTVLAY